MKKLQYSQKHRSIKGTAHPASDLDLCYKGNVTLLEIDELEEAFRQSDLPFKVEIISLDRCSNSFKKVIVNDLILLTSIL